MYNIEHGLSGKSNYSVLLITSIFQTNFPAFLAFDIISLPCDLVVPFISVAVNRDDKPAGSVVELCCIQWID
jgi:hypothetical protein